MGGTASATGREYHQGVRRELNHPPALVQFAIKYGCSLDWLVLGNVGPRIVEARRSLQQRRGTAVEQREADTLH